MPTKTKPKLGRPALASNKGRRHMTIDVQPATYQFLKTQREQSGRSFGRLIDLLVPGGTP